MQRPVVGPDLRQPPSLVPVVKPPATASAPTPVQPPAQTFYYQKDAAAIAETVAHQVPEQPKVGTPVPPTATLPKSAINVTPPLVGQIRVWNEAELRQDIEAEVKRDNESEIFAKFPTDYEPMAKGPEGQPLAYTRRSYPPSVEQVEPMFVCYGRLYFEDKNSERYGWELGILQPVISAGIFYGDILKFPYNVGTRPCQKFEADAGYCLPGDPVPYLIYPIELSLTGGLLEAGTFVGLSAIFQ